MTRDGHSYRRLASGRGAIEAISGITPTFVLLDIALPDISGYQIIEEMRADPALRDVRDADDGARLGHRAQRRAGAWRRRLSCQTLLELSELRSELARLLAPPCWGGCRCGCGCF